MRGRIRVYLLGAWVLGSIVKSAAADASQNPYHAIVERNVFGLKPPPAAVPAEPIGPPPPKITLTGITTILGDKRALLKTQVPPRPPEPAKEESYILAEGQRDGDIEVLSIDEKAGSVTVNNHGTVQELTFDKDGVKPSGMPALPANTTIARPIMAVPPPMRTLPNRAVRLPTPP